MLLLLLLLLQCAHTSAAPHPCPVGGWMDEWMDGNKSKTSIASQCSAGLANVPGLSCRQSSQSVSQSVSQYAVFQRFLAVKAPNDTTRTQTRSGLGAQRGPRCSLACTFWSMDVVLRQAGVRVRSWARGAAQRCGLAVGAVGPGPGPGLGLGLGLRLGPGYRYLHTTNAIHRPPPHPCPSGTSASFFLLPSSFTTKNQVHH
ncbi:hypothetical protein IWX46DRAFT_577476 [Phyllosticta citricarpa]|uniref:Uncharacterized protein n=1 Tax=Phyllosticta citricarpa TaxID=55181 RepID=A0ABR1MTC9_9PEZI